MNTRPSATKKGGKGQTRSAAPAPSTRSHRRETGRSQSRAKIDPFGGARPVETRQPSGGRDMEKPKPRAKMDPFGGARPVDIKQPSAPGLWERLMQRRKEEEEEKGYQHKHNHNHNPPPIFYLHIYIYFFLSFGKQTSKMNYRNFTHLFSLSLQPAHTPTASWRRWLNI